MVQNLELDGLYVAMVMEVSYDVRDTMEGILQVRVLGKEERGII